MTRGDTRETRERREFRRGFAATLLCAPAFISRVSRGDEADLPLTCTYSGHAGVWYYRATAFACVAVPVATILSVLGDNASLADRWQARKGLTPVESRRDWRGKSLQMHFVFIAARRESILMGYRSSGKFLRKLCFVARLSSEFFGSEEC